MSLILHCGGVLTDTCNALTQEATQEATAMNTPAAAQHCGNKVQSAARYTLILLTSRTQTEHSTLAGPQDGADSTQTGTAKWNANSASLASYQLPLEGGSQGSSVDTVTERPAVKVKFTLEQAMKTQRGSRGISLLFL
jgi:hypothetical protein